MKTNNKLQMHALGLLGLLSLEYMLGVWSGLFVEFPEESTPAQLWDFGLGQWSVLLHALLGVALVFGAVALVVSASKVKDAVWKKAGWIGLVAMLAALFGGERFVSSQNDWFTLIMATGLVVAAAAYVWGLVATKGEK